MQANVIAAGLVMFVACTGASATSSLSFEASGYILDFEVGYDHRSVIASVNVGTPGSKDGITVRFPQLVVDAFDTDRKILIVRFTNPGDASLPPSFSFTVHRETGILRVDGRSFRGAFKWDM